MISIICINACTADKESYHSAKTFLLPMHFATLYHSGMRTYSFWLNDRRSEQNNVYQVDTRKSTLGYLFTASNNSAVQIEITTFSIFQ